MGDPHWVRGARGVSTAFSAVRCVYGVTGVEVKALVVERLRANASDVAANLTIVRCIDYCLLLILSIDDLEV